MRVEVDLCRQECIRQFYLLAQYQIFISIRTIPIWARIQEASNSGYVPFHYFFFNSLVIDTRQIVLLKGNKFVLKFHTLIRLQLDNWDSFHLIDKSFNSFIIFRASFLGQGLDSRSPEKGEGGLAGGGMPKEVWL